MPPPAIERLARAIDHTQLDASAEPGAIERLCEEARDHGFAAVCVHGRWVTQCAGSLRGAVRVAAVVSFPHGLDATAAKRCAAAAALAEGADELDVVIAHALLGTRPDAVARDLAAVVEAARAERPDAVVKAIVEAPLLGPAELEQACRIVAASGADYAKTGTGTAGAATPEQVATMRRLLPPGVRLKASGGIRTAQSAVALLDAGADRIGTSSGVDIIRQMGVHAVA